MFTNYFKTILGSLPPFLTVHMNKLNKYTSTSSKDLDNEKLIEAVRKRPDLYKTHDDGYVDIYIKRKQWEEVCAELFPNWNFIKHNDKMNTCLRMQRRWKNISDCFRRDLQLRRKLHQPKDHKKYPYYNQLCFLLPYVLEQKDSDEFYYPTNVDNEFKGGDGSGKVAFAEDEIIYLPELSDTQKNDASTMTGDETNTKDVLKKAENDEDKLFLLSLASSFQNLTDEQKLLVKVDFLRILRKILYTN